MTEPPELVVRIAYNGEAGVWYVAHCELDGLNVEAKTLDELLAKLPDAVRELIEIAEDEDEGGPSHD
jgi:predicted RNase H-like HicB family nuclease